MTPTRSLAARITTSAAGLAAISALAGCASNTADAATAASGDSASSGGAATYQDGTYTADGTYQTPGGQETLTVTLAVKNGTVTSVKATGSGSTPNAQHYEQAFESGMAAVVVGKQLATLQVGTIAGSSLTPQGFNAAVDKIKTEAA